jgi:hypothetical protein
MSILSGTAGAPLRASRSYTFFERSLDDGKALLWISATQRGSWDDFGVVDHPEQDAWLRAFVRSLGVPFKEGYPGEWIFPDRAGLEHAWAALGAALAPPVTAPIVAERSRALTRDEASKLDLGARYLELVSSVTGCSMLEKQRSNVDTSGPEPIRTETWRGDHICARLSARGIESGVGIHGEECAWSIDARSGDERDARVTARIDARTGGHVSVTVRGVLDAEELAARFTAGLTPS